MRNIKGLLLHPRPLSGLQPATRPVVGFRLPNGGPLSVLPPPPPSAWRFFLPASGKRRQQSAKLNSSPPPQPKRRPRSRLLLFRCCGFAFSLAAPAGEGVVPPELRPDATTPAPPYSSFRSVGIIRPARSLTSRIMPRQRHPPANARGGRRFGLPASTPVQARRRSLPRPVPAPPPSAATHAPGNEVPARPAAASRCSPRSRLSLSASVSPRRFRRKRGSRSVLPVCRRQPSRRMLLR